MTVPSFVYAADTHNLASSGRSWLEPEKWGEQLGNAGKFAALSVVSGLNSFYNLGVTVGNFFGGDFKEKTADAWVSSWDSDWSQYYKNNQDSIDTWGAIAASMIPGMAGIKVLHVGQAALQASKAGMVGGNMRFATGLLTPNVERNLAMSIEQINASTSAFKAINANTVRALGSGLHQNVLEAAAFEVAVQATMFKNPVLEKQDFGDIVQNVVIGSALGGGIFGIATGAKMLSKYKQAVRAEDEVRAGLTQGPGFAPITSPADRIITLAEDSNSAFVPDKISDIATGEKLLKEKLVTNNLKIRSEFHALSEGDKNVANIIANTAEGGSTQDYFENMFGAVALTRVDEVSRAEVKAIASGKEIAGRYVKILGEDMGAVTSDTPVMRYLGDLHKSPKEVIGAAREAKFKLADLWKASDLKGKQASLTAEKRQVWAKHILSEIPDGTRIHIEDFPVLERALKDKQLKIEIIGNKGEVITPSTESQLFDLITNSKVDTSYKMLESQLSTKQVKYGTDPQLITEQLATIVNVKRSYLESLQTSNQAADLFANQSHHADYLSTLDKKGISREAEEYTDPLLLPKHARVAYEVNQELAEKTSTFVDALVYMKEKQKLYQQQADNVVARILGKDAFDTLPDFPDELLAKATRAEGGAKLLAAENANYGTVGSLATFIGQRTNKFMGEGKKRVQDVMGSALVRLAQSTDDAIAYEAINRQVLASGKLWRFDKEEGLLKSVEKSAEDVIETIPVNSELVRELIELKSPHDGRITQGFKEIRAAQGYTDEKLTDIFRPTKPDLDSNPHFAFVVDPKVTATGHVQMIHAATEKELRALADKVPKEYEVKFKGDTEDYYKARQEYQFGRTLHESRINSDLVNKGVMSNFFPKSDSKKIADDILRQMYRESDTLVRETVSLKYAPQFQVLENMGTAIAKVDTSKFASRAEVLKQSADNPFLNQIKTALDISKSSELGIWHTFNKTMDQGVSKVVRGIQELRGQMTSPEELIKIEAALDKAGIKPAFFDASLHALANHQAPKGELTKFVRKGNSLLGLFTIGLDPLNALTNALGANLLRSTEISHVTDAIKAADPKLAGKLAELLGVDIPGVPGSKMTSSGKLLANATKAFWQNKELRDQYKSLGFISDRLEQLNLLVDDFTLKGTETVAELEKRAQGAFKRTEAMLEDKGVKWTGNKITEEFNRFVAANMMHQITDLAVQSGVMNPKEALSYINTFVNRVEGTIVASQRPQLFQGPIGQAIGLFQSYQFNMLQQLFRYVGEGSKKDVAMLAGLQSTLFGLQSLPGFHAINTHVIGKMGGNTENKDVYDLAQGTAGKSASDWLLYGLPSNILKANLYSRGDINPRHITVIPTSIQETPIFSGWAKFFSNIYNTTTKLADGANVWQSLVQGLEHNGISRPLAGLAQVIQGVTGDKVISTTNNGSILGGNDLFAWASAVRIAGGRPLDEATANDAVFRVKAYEVSRAAKLKDLKEAIRSTLVQPDQGATDAQVNSFALRYTELGGKQPQFNKWMMDIYRKSTVSQAEQLATSLKNPYAYKLQLAMGGQDE